MAESLMRDRKPKKRGLSIQDDELVPVRTVQGHLVGEMLKSKLESEGIPAILRYESVGHIMGITFDGLGQVQVMVPRALAKEAENALAAAEPIQELPPEEKKE
jgi:hypothetical protein